MHILRLTSVAVLIGAMASPIWGATESSCPAPCTKPPSTNIFVRELAGTLDVSGNIAGLQGRIARGKKHAVLKVDVTFLLSTNNGVTGIYQVVSVNGVPLGGVSGGEYVQPCPAANSLCTLTTTHWLALDAAEAEHPGMFIKKPLDIGVSGGSYNIAGSGNVYQATVTAELLKGN